MRRVVDSRQVAHLWANQSQPDARNAQGTYYFSGASLWSYGSHFEVGRIARRGARTAALITTNRYSNTTAKHISFAERAASHLTVFHVSLHATHSRDGTLGSWFKDYKHRYKSHLDAAKRARVNKAWKLRYAIEAAEEANAFAEFFGLKSRIAIPEDLRTQLEAAEERDRVMAERDRVMAEERDRVMADKDRARMAEDLPRWLAGEIDYLPRRVSRQRRADPRGPVAHRQHGHGRKREGRLPLHRVVADPRVRAGRRMVNDPQTALGIQGFAFPPA